MKKSFAILALVLLFSTNSVFAGEVKRIEAGGFRVEYQITSNAKSLSQARKACADLGDNGTWKLPTGMEFWGTLMTGNSLFTTVPAKSGNGYLGWVAGNDVPPTPPGGPDDFVISVEDGKGTQTDFISISEVLRNFTDENLAKVPADRRGTFQTIKDTLNSGVQVVCYRPLAK